MQLITGTRAAHLVRAGNVFRQLYKMMDSEKN
jgi:hypothetical protein